MVDWKKPPTEALHDKQRDEALADHHAQEGREAAAQSPTGVAYEKLDVDPVSIARLGLVLVVTAVVVVGLSYGLFVLFRAREARREPARPPLAIREVGRVPPEPRLQTTPMSDLARLRAQQQEELQRYGWVDSAQGRVRIPMDEAMRLYAERQAARAGAGTGAGADLPPAPSDASAPYPPAAGGVWPGAPGPEASPGAAPLGTPAPSPAAAATPAPHGGHE